MFHRRPLAATLLCLALLPVGARAAESLDLGNGVTLDFVLVPAGTFTIGSPDDQPGHKPDEQLTEKTIPDDFYMSRTPITRAQFARFVEAARFRTEAERGNSGGYGVVNGKLADRQSKEFTWKNPGFPQADDHPVVLVTFNDAEAFARWASQRTGRTLRLPTEIEWEYACRASTTTRFYSGDTDADGDRIAWHAGNSDGTTHPVARKDPNALGLFDMSGNVWQWCTDRYGPYQPGGPIAADDVNTPRKVLRGGSFLRPRNDARSADRYRNRPGSRNADNGFRLVMTTAPRLPVEAATPAPQPPAVGKTPPVTPANPSATRMPSSPAIAQPVAQEVHFSSGFGFGGVLCMAIPCIAFLAILAFVIKLIVGRANNPQQFPTSPTMPSRPPGPAPQVAQDGFWVDTSRYTPGTPVRYRYRGPGGWVENSFIAEPGNQFIYTGMTPTGIMILGAAAAAAGAAATEFFTHPTPPPIPPTTQPTTRPFSTRNYPSAY